MKPKRIRHSASNDGATPALKAAFAMMPPTPKHEAAVNANAYPSARRRGGASLGGTAASDAGPTETLSTRETPSLVGTQAAIDEVIEDQVRLRIREAEFALVGLALPQIGCRRLSYHDVRHAEVH